MQWSVTVRTGNLKLCISREQRINEIQSVDFLYTGSAESAEKW